MGPRGHVGRLAVVLTLAAAGLAVTGCGGGGESADLEAGKTVFANNCASCHTLADSGKPPTRIGPNLDDAWRASRAAGIEDEQFAGTIERWIEIAQLPMPRDLVRGQDARNVAAYIASVAGRNADSEVYKATTTPEVPNPSRQDQH